jgi:hypothetical protein
MSADIDLDFGDRDKVLKLINAIPARQLVQNQVRRHASGIYVTEIPYDPINQCSAIDYKEAVKRGYFKIDLLNMSVYQLIKSQQHYDAMLSKEPNWQRLWIDANWTKNIVHIGNYSDLIVKMKPDSITRMAAFIAIIRPGKAHLQNLSWQEIFKSVWDGDDSKGFVFKKSHSISYAMLVILHMNLLDELNPAFDAQV